MIDLFFESIFLCKKKEMSKSTPLIIILLFLLNTVIAQITVDWQRTNGTTQADAADFPTCSVSDDAGNTYISGRTSINSDLFLMKVSSSGQLLWQKSFDVQQTNSGDYYSRITLDNQQNVILASPDRYNAGLFITKVSSTGSIIWSDTLNPDTYYTVRKVITDSSNNIFIGGVANGDIVLIKYDQNGVLQYNLNIDGGLSIDDNLRDISLDSNNDIILSANRGSIPGDNCAIVFKYGTNGNQIWNTVIAHANTTQISLSDHAILDNEIVVCGYFYNTVDSYRGFLTKLSASGVQSSVAVDPQISSAYNLVSVLGNELVVGVYDPQAFNTVSTSVKRFTAALSEVWNAELPFGGTIFQLATNQNADVFIFSERGNFPNVYNTVHKYTGEGNLAWGFVNDSSTYLGRSEFMSFSSNGNVRLTAPYYHSNEPYNENTDIKLFDLNSSSGQLNWTYQYDGAVLSYDKADLMTKDSQGNMIIAGTFEAGFSNNAVGVAKYNSTGDLLWIKKLDFSVGINKDDEPLSITCDAQDNLIVAGYSTNTNRDFLLFKLNPSGDVVWQKVFNGSGNNTDQFNSVVTDAASNVYVAGRTARDFGVDGIYYVHQVYKYSPSGVELWENWDYSTPTGTEKIILSPSQLMVYVACEYYGSSTNPSDLAVFKLRADNGSYVRWASYSGTSNNSSDKIKGIAMDSLENIYLNGNVNNAGFKVAVIKYDSTLTEVWDNVYPNSGTGNKFYQDQNQDLLVTLGTITSDSVSMIKYNKNGSIIWTKKLLGSNNTLITNAYVKQLNDVMYAVVSDYNQFGLFVHNVFIMDTSGNVLTQFITNNTESRYLRDIQTNGNELYTCGFFSERTNIYTLTTNYFIDKYTINVDNIQNQAPTISAIENSNVCNNLVTFTIPFTVSDENIGLLNLIATSSNENVIPNNALTISGTGNQQTLTISILSSTTGQTTISIAVIDELGLNVSTSFSILLELCLSNENLNSDLITIYPNPANNQLTINLENPMPNSSIQIINVLGQLQKEQLINSSNEIIDVHDLVSGTYNLLVKTNETIVSRKLIQVIH